MSESWKPEFPSWKDRFPDLTWWLDLNEGKKFPRGTFEIDTKPVVDNTTGQVWEMYLDHRGLPTDRVRVNPGGVPTKFGQKHSELKYEVWQYALIVWCLQKVVFDDWRPLECFHIIKHFWRNLPGQAPLIPQTVGVWTASHYMYKKEGILWP